MIVTGGGKEIETKSSNSVNGTADISLTKSGSHVASNLTRHNNPSSSPQSFRQSILLLFVKGSHWNERFCVRAICFFPKIHRRNGLFCSIRAAIISAGVFISLRVWVSLHGYTVTEVTPTSPWLAHQVYEWIVSVSSILYRAFSRLTPKQKWT
jgi:hypothetical protein